MFPGLLVPIPDRGVVKMYEKRRLGCVFLAMIAWFRPLWHVPHSVNVARFHFSAVFWNRAASHTPVVAEKCRKTQFGGMKCVGKTHFGRKNVARFEICPENRNRATKFAVSFRDLLSLGRFSRYGVRYKLGVRTVGQEAQWRAQGLPIAIVEGARLRERLDHARPAHGVRRALWQEPLRPASQGHCRRRDYARPQPEELTKVWFRVFRLSIFQCLCNSLHSRNPLV